MIGLSINKMWRRKAVSNSLCSSWCFISVVLCTFICTLLTTHVQPTEARYPEQFLESVEVCAAGSFGTLGTFAKKKIRLANFPNNTVSVKLTRWADLYKSFYHFRCRFQVSAPKSMGVMMVIQSLNLRNTNGLCRDFIQFQSDGLKSPHICGTVDESDVSKVPERIVGPRKFVDPKGEMDVTFFTDGEDDDTDANPISLNLIFTAYKECTPAALKTNTVRQCSTLRSHSCIPSQLFCDGVINCAFNDEDFGADEKNCRDQNGREMDDVDRTVSIYVFAITTVATLVIVVIFSLIVCCCLRRFAKQRRAADTYGRGMDGMPMRNHGHHHNMHHGHHQSGAHGPDVIRLDTTGPTVPLRTHEPSPEKMPVMDMDQPPPYDALFPSAKPSSKPCKKQ